MINKRLAETKMLLRTNGHFKDVCEVMGCSLDEKKELQYITNLKKDIEELEFLKKCLKNREQLEMMFHII